MEQGRVEAFSKLFSCLYYCSKSLKAGLLFSFWLIVLIDYSDIWQHNSLQLSSAQVWTTKDRVEDGEKLQSQNILENYILLTPL